MQAFLGLANYLRHFIPCLATMAAPLDELRNAKWIDVDDINVRMPLCQDAFLGIKDAVASAPALCRPDWRAPFLVATDASAVGLGCVLFQGSREAPRYIRCASRSLTPVSIPICCTYICALMRRRSCSTSSRMMNLLMSSTSIPETAGRRPRRG
jgi:hypothetical protein